MTSLASSFKYNGFSINAPVGTIVSFLGTSDPDGWLICDGEVRTGGAGRYAALKDILNTAMGVTENSNDSVRPPNLKNRFLYGRTSTSTTTSTTAGSSTKTLSEANMPAHTHSVSATQAEHDHTIEEMERFNLDGDNSTLTGGDGKSRAGSTLTSKATPIITVTELSKGSGTAFDIMPPYFTVNYIIKY